MDANSPINVNQRSVSGSSRMVDIFFIFGKRKPFIVNRMCNEVSLNFLKFRKFHRFIFDSIDGLARKEANFL